MVVRLEIHHKLSRRMADWSLSRKRWQIFKMNYFTGKIEEIQRTIPVSHRNPHRFLQKALEKWEKSEET